MARNAVTAVKAEERASPMPKLHKANTVAWGLLNAGRWVLIIAVHSMIRLWLDIVALLGLLGFTDTLSMAHGGLSGHGPSIQFPKNLPQKGGAGGHVWCDATSAHLPALLLIQPDRIPAHNIVDTEETAGILALDIVIP